MLRRDAADAEARVGRFGLRVYYEDTDFGGIVYYANYLKFIERGRSELLRSLGIDQIELKEQGLVFAVSEISAKYLSPARFDDWLEVDTSIERLSPARIYMAQKVSRGEKTLFQANVTIVTIDSEGRPRRLPEALNSLFTAARS